MKKSKIISPKTNPQQPNNQLFGGLILMLLVVGSMYLAFNSKGAPNSTPRAAASSVADETAGWYLYQTKRNKFFEVKHPHTWSLIYGGGVEGEELLQVKSSNPKVDFNVLARSNRGYTDLESFLKEVDETNQTSPGFHILKEERLIVDGRPAAKREEYVIARQTYSMVTYILDKDIVVELSADFPNARLITPSARALHRTLLSTFRFLK